MGDCAGDAQYVDDRVDVGKLVEVYLVPRHAVDLRLCVHDDVEDGGGVRLDARLRVDALYHPAHVPDGQVNVGRPYQEVHPLDCPPASSLGPDLRHIDGELGEEVRKRRKRTARVDKGAYRHIAAYAECRVEVEDLHRRLIKVAK